MNKHVARLAKWLFAAWLALPPPAFAVEGKVSAVVSPDFPKQELSEIQAALGISVGEPLRPSRISDGIRSLVEAGRVETLFVETEREGGGLRVILKGSRLRRIRNVRFVNVGPAIVEEARANVLLAQSQTTDQRILSELREQLRRAYERRGYYNAKVSVDIKPVAGSPDADVELSVEPNAAVTVKEVRLVGVLPEEAKRMLGVMTLAPGSSFSQERLASDVEALNEYLQKHRHLTSKVEQTSLAFNEDKTEVTVNVFVKLGQRFQFEIAGNKVFSDVELRDLMSEEVLIQLNGAQRVAESIREKYRAIGHHFCEVRIVERTEQRGKLAIVRFQVREGPKVIIDRLHFGSARPEIGTSRALDEDELRRMFLEGAPGVLARGVYWEAGVAPAMKSLQSRIEAMGYLNARLSEPKTIFTEDRKGVELFFDLELGTRTLVTEVEIEGGAEVSSSELKQAIPLKVGEPFSRSMLAESRETVEKLYRERGYAEAKVIQGADDVRFSRDQSGAVVRLVVKEGRRYRVGSVSIEGNAKTRDKVILREMTIAPGDIYNPAKVRESEERITLLGLFSRVEILTVEPKESPSTKDLKVVVREVQPGLGEIGFGGTYEDPLFRLRAFGGLGYLNIFGLNHTASLRGELRLPISGDRVFPFFEYFTTAGYRSPYPFDIPVNFTAQVGLDSFQVAVQPTTSQLQTRARFEGKIEKKVGKAVTVIYRLYRLERTNTETLDAGLNVTASDIDVIGSTGPGLIVDLRDDPFNPTKGSYHLLDFEFAHPVLLSNSDISFIMGLSRNSVYIPFFEPFSLTAYVGLGYARSLLDGAPIPKARLVNDLSLGGQGSLRGFAVRQFSPGDRSRETAFYNLRGEIGTQIFDKAKFVVFMDSGQIFPDLTAQPRHDGVGIGFRYITPVGPVAVDLAHGLGREGKAIQFYFSIGTL